MDCNSGWMDRKEAGLLGNQPQSCWDEGYDAGCQIFMINSGSLELPATEGSPRTARTTCSFSLLFSQGSRNTDTPGVFPL